MNSYLPCQVENDDWTGLRVRRLPHDGTVPSVGVPLEGEGASPRPPAGRPREPSDRAVTILLVAGPSVECNLALAPHAQRWCGRESRLADDAVEDGVGTVPKVDHGCIWLIGGGKTWTFTERTRDGSCETSGSCPVWLRQPSGSGYSSSAWALRARRRRVSLGPCVTVSNGEK